MNINPTQPSVGQLKRTAIYVAIFMAIGGSTRIATAQVYEPGSIIHGKSIGDWVAVYADRWEGGRSGQILTDIAQRASLMQLDQTGPVFFYPYSWGSYNQTIELEVPEGAPILLPFGLITAWDADGGTSENRAASETKIRGYQTVALSIDDTEIPVDKGQILEGGPYVRQNSDPNSWAGCLCVALEPLSVGTHTISNVTTFIGNVRKEINATINVFTPESIPLGTGETYIQGFDELGTDGTAVSSLPSGWTVTDEHAFALFQRETNTQFPSSSSLLPNKLHVFNAGDDGADDRALAIASPRSRPLGETIQFLADSPATGANSLELDFAIEAWDQVRQRTTNTPGSAAFNVLVDIDTGEGFKQLFDLGTISTGDILAAPEGEFLNGNETTNRVTFQSGKLDADIPADSRLRFRWATNMAPETSDDWVFGLDDVRLTLHGDLAELTGDFNSDGNLGIDDLDTLTTAIQANTVDTVYDLDGSGVVDLADRQHWVTDVRKTWIGDVNLDGVFDTSDMITAISSGQYDDDINGNSTWSTGDWNGDGEFDSGDLIAAFSDGGYEAGPRAAVAAVPEPNTTLLTLILSMPFAVKAKRAGSTGFASGPWS